MWLGEVDLGLRIWDLAGGTAERQPGKMVGTKGGSTRRK